MEIQETSTIRANQEAREDIGDVGLVGAGSVFYQLLHPVESVLIDNWSVSSLHCDPIFLRDIYRFLYLIRLKCLLVIAHVADIHAADQDALNRRCLPVIRIIFAEPVSFLAQYHTLIRRRDQYL